MDKLREELLNLKDPMCQEFNSKLIPNIPKDKVLGIKIPELRKLAKKYKDKKEYLDDLPHKYNEENILHGLIIAEIKDYNEFIEEMEKFLPYIDNWMVCDTISPKVVKKHKDELLNKIKVWIKSKETYTIRFGLRMLMNYYLDSDYKKEYLNLPLKIKSNEYYVNMMIAWYYATALAKQYDDTIKIIENKKLDTWVHNKTIQKAKESFRVSKEQKEYLNQLKIK